MTDVAIFKDTYASLLRQSIQIPSPDWRLAEAGESAEAYALRCAQALETHLQQHHATTAAVIVEPLVQCAAGMGMYHEAYLQHLRALCDQYDVHLIADEIAVGFGRTGTLFACEQAGIRPDFLCLSKGITGGYLPLSVCLTTDAIYQAFYDDSTARGFLHSHSYTGNALACSAALATLDIFAEEDVIARNRDKAAAMNVQLQALQDLPIHHLRQRGMIWAFDVESARPDFSRQFYLEALQHGLILRPIGNTVYFMPPYCITPDEMSTLVDHTAQILRKLG